MNSAIDTTASIRAGKFIRDNWLGIFSSSQRANGPLEDAVVSLIMEQREVGKRMALAEIKASSGKRFEGAVQP
jgi:hypothetical protein